MIIKFTKLLDLIQTHKFSKLVLIVKANVNISEVCHELGLKESDVEIRTMDRNVTIDDLSQSDEEVTIYPSDYQEDIVPDPRVYHYIRYNLNSTAPKKFSCIDLHCQLDKSWSDHYQMLRTEVA